MSSAGEAPVADETAGEQMWEQPAERRPTGSRNQDKRHNPAWYKKDVVITHNKCEHRRKMHNVYHTWRNRLLYGCIYRRLLACHPDETRRGSRSRGNSRLSTDSRNQGMRHKFFCLLTPCVPSHLRFLRPWSPQRELPIAQPCYFSFRSPFASPCALAYKRTGPFLWPVRTGEV